MNHIETYTATQSKRLNEIKTKFLQSLHDLSKQTMCSYYDFLMVAKQLGFRFEEASHLMTLKNYFSKNNNLLDKNKLVQLLILNVSAQGETSSDKTIIKFALSDQQTLFDPIQEVTNEDQQNYQTQRNYHLKSQIVSEESGSQKRSGSFYNSVDFKEKIEVIVSMKMHQMTKKVEILSKALKESSPFEEIKETITIMVFRKVVIKIFNFNYERIKVSDDDIKTIFFLLDTEKKNQLTIDQIDLLKNPGDFYSQLREFYKFRINPELIKNTELKRGRFGGNNTIQVFQLKNPSTLQLKQIQSVLTGDSEIKRTLPSTKPRFGPLRHSYNRRKSSPIPEYKSAKRHPSIEILMQKGKIQKILKASKQKKREKSDSNETITSRLRRLFIHKVILPRQRMLDQQKDLERKNQNTYYNLQVKSDRL